MNAQQKAENDLREILTARQDFTDGGTAIRWGGTGLGTPRLRKQSAGSMNNLSNLDSNGLLGGGVRRLQHQLSRPPPTYRHSVQIETYPEGDDEILESLVRSTTQQTLRTQERSRRKARYGERKSRKLLDETIRFKVCLIKFVFVQ